MFNICTVKIAVHSAKGCCTATTMALTSIKQGFLMALIYTVYIQSEFDPTTHKRQPAANQQTFAFSPITSKTVTLPIKSLKLDKRGGLSGMPAMICRILVDLILFILLRFS